MKVQPLRKGRRGKRLAKKDTEDRVELVSDIKTKHNSVYDDKNVGVVPAEIINKYLTPVYTKPDARVSVHTETTTYMSPIRTVIRESLMSVPGEKARNYDKYKQIIPFVVIVGYTGNAKKDGTPERVFFTHRTVDDLHLEIAHEQREVYSLGVYGHIKGGEGIYEALYRIIEEQTGIVSKEISTCRFQGYIYDNPAHIGLVFVARVDMTGVTLPKHEFAWKTITELQTHVKDTSMGDWSKIVYENVLSKSSGIQVSIY